VLGVDQVFVAAGKIISDTTHNVLRGSPNPTVTYLPPLPIIQRSSNVNCLINFMGILPPP